ncbi:hypothetical protein CXR25_15010 [Brevibacterium aurantiacum]|nr:hypothetical protein CXR25_15010 [Brevibacterium aurantiacum]
MLWNGSTTGSNPTCPSISPTRSSPGEWETALTFAFLALSFVFRPLGGFVLGPLGDKVGRHRHRTNVGVTEARSSRWVPWRVPPRRLDCTILLVTVGTDGVDASRWRRPFLRTLALGGVALRLRMKLDEPEAFSKATTQQQKNRQPFSELFTEFKRQIVMLMAFVVLLNIGQHMALTYMPTDFAETLGHSQIESKLMLAALLLAMIIVVSPLDWLTDTIGRKPFLYASTTGFAVLSVPVFMLMQAVARGLQFLGLGIIALLQVMMQSCVSATLPAIAPRSISQDSPSATMLRPQSSVKPRLRSTLLSSSPPTSSSPQLSTSWVRGSLGSSESISSTRPLNVRCLIERVAVPVASPG